jgi:hypothetical protein
MGRPLDERMLNDVFERAFLLGCRVLGCRRLSNHQSPVRADTVIPA